MKKSLRVFLSVVLLLAVAFANTAGPNFPTAATGTTNTIGAGTKTWATPTNIEANDGTFTQVNFIAAATSDDLIGTGFGFAIAGTDTINGILLEINYKSPNGLVIEDFVQLLKAGVATGTNKSTGAVIPVGAATVSYGGAADLWGTTWTPAQVNASNFGAAFVCIASGSDTASVDFFRITITSTAAATAKSNFLQMFTRNTMPQVRTQTRTFKITN